MPFLWLGWRFSPRVSLGHPSICNSNVAFMSSTKFQFLPTGMDRAQIRRTWNETGKNNWQVRKKWDQQGIRSNDGEGVMRRHLRNATPVPPSHWPRPFMDTKQSKCLLRCITFSRTKWILWCSKWPILSCPIEPLLPGFGPNLRPPKNGWLQLVNTKKY